MPDALYRSRVMKIGRRHVKAGPRNSPEHYDRLREILGATRLALTSTVVAAGFAVVGVSGRVWAFAPAAVAALFAILEAPVAWRGYRAAEQKELADLLSGNVCRAADARAVEYGIDPEVLPHGQAWHYVHRDFEHELRGAIGAALSGEGSRLVMLCGERKSGKTRAALQMLKCDELRQAWLVVPRDGASVEALLRPGALPRHLTPLIVWLDGLERFASVDATGLHEGTFRNMQCDRPIALLATAGERRLGDTTGELIDPVEQLEGLAVCIDVPVKLTPNELASAERAYMRGVVGEIEQMGLGRRMVAMHELRDRLTRSYARCREGLAVTRAAIDWRRAGVRRPLSADQLDLLYRHYLPDDLDPSDELFAAGLKWARESLPNTKIALLRKPTDGSDGYEPYGLAVEVAEQEWPALEEATVRRIGGLAKPEDCFQMAGIASDAGNTALALGLLGIAERAEDSRLAATSAFNTGVLLARCDDLDGARDAYRRADAAGGMRGAYNLGQLLRHRGELGEAESAYRRADERGSAEGAVNLGALLEQRGELAAAEAAYRRAQERGSRMGERNLGRLLTGLVVCALAVFGCSMLSNRASAAGLPGSIEEFPIETIYEGSLGAIATGPEGSVWVDQGSYSPYAPNTGVIERMSLGGLITGYYTLPLGVIPLDLERGIGGDMWYTGARVIPDNEPFVIGRITPAGTITEYPITVGTPRPYAESEYTGPTSIAQGADGNMWFTDQHRNSEGRRFIGRVTASGDITEFWIPIGRRAELPEASVPQGIALGADGSMWFTDDGANTAGRNLIGRITASGAITEYPIPTPGSMPGGIALGADGNMWFSEPGVNRIGSITPAGEITEYPTPGATGGVTLGPDGNIWFTGHSEVDPIGWITPSGLVRTLPPTLLGSASLGGIVAGADGNIWYTDARPSEREHVIGSFIGRIVTPYAPKNFNAPVISGEAAEGNVLSVSTGIWGNSPTAFSYRWQRCDPQLLSCEDISGASQATYFAVARDANQVLRAIVTASNVGGEESAVSTPSPIIQAAPPQIAHTSPPPPATRTPIIAAAVTWRFAPSRRYTIVRSLVVHGLPTGGFADTTCRGRGCAFVHVHSAPTAARRSCRKHVCVMKKTSGAHDELDLTGFFKARRLRPGVRISVAVVKSGWVGKSFDFVIAKGRAPSVNVLCLAPGLISESIPC
jgi:streptogramin lyase/nitroreductase